MNRWLVWLIIVASILIAVIITFRLRPKEAEVPRLKVKKAPLIALVLDDFGYEKRHLNTLGKIGVPITLAVLPNAPYTKEVCSFAKKKDFEVIVHLPMEPENPKESLEKDTIITNMDNKTITRIVKKALKDVPSARGISNHMGSKATSDKRVITTLFKDLKSKKLFFLDSFTTKKSVCGKVAKDLKLPYAKRDVFIDNRLEKKYIKEQLNKAKRVAIKKGRAIAIGHDRSLTINVLKEVVSDMESSGIRFVCLTEVIRE